MECSVFTQILYTQIHVNCSLFNSGVILVLHFISEVNIVLFTPFHLSNRFNSWFLLQIEILIKLPVQKVLFLNLKVKNLELQSLSGKWKTACCSLYWPFIGILAYKPDTESYKLSFMNELSLFEDIHKLKKDWMDCFYQ